MKTIGIYDELLYYNKYYNKDLNSQPRNKMNIVLSSSVFFQKSEHLLHEIFEHEVDSPFTVCMLKFSEVELKLLLQLPYPHPPLIGAAKRRVHLLQKLKNYNTFSFFKSFTDIIRIEHLDAPICFVICNLNEGLDICKLSLDSSMYVFFNAYEKALFDIEEIKWWKPFMTIRKVVMPYDQKLLTLNPITKCKHDISKNDLILINEKLYVVGQNLKLFNDDGGEANLFKMNPDSGEVVKIFKFLSSNKSKKIHFLLRANGDESLLPLFCTLPKALAKSKNGELIGYCMNFVDGVRLDRYIYNLSQDENITIIRVVKVFMQIALAVRTVHLSDLVIGDLCASNFMVENSGKVRIVDCDSFQIMNYPCEGFHFEASSYEGKFLSCADDFYLLKLMFDHLIEYFNQEIVNEYTKIVNTYHSFINDVSGFIYAFYYYLHMVEEI